MANENFNFDDLQVQEKIRADAAEKARRKQREEIDDIRIVMRTPQGRRVMYGFLARAGVYRSGFNSNALNMAFNEGMRESGLILTKMLTDHCFAQYQLMMKEGIENG